MFKGFYQKTLTIRGDLQEKVTELRKQGYNEKCDGLVTVKPGYQKRLLLLSFLHASEC